MPASNVRDQFGNVVQVLEEGQCVFMQDGWVVDEPEVTEPAPEPAPEPEPVPEVVPEVVIPAPEPTPSASTPEATA